MNFNNVNYCFKGNRDYVHGTDIFNSINTMIEDNKKIKSIDCIFHGITKKNLNFSYIKPNDSQQIKVVYIFEENNNKKHIYGMENINNVECRYDYDENSIINKCEINLEKQFIVLITKTKFTFVEHIVAMQKALLQSIYAHKKGKWFFTRLQLKEVPDEQNLDKLNIRMVKNFNFKLIKSEILDINANKLGDIYFSLVKEV